MEFKLSLNPIVCVGAMDQGEKNICNVDKSP